MITTPQDPQKSALFATSSFNQSNIGSIFIPTKDRPAELARLLASFQTKWFKDYEGVIIVADSSTQHQTRCQVAVEELAHRLPCPVIYRSDRTTEDLVTYLAQETSLDCELLKIGLLGQPGMFSVGACRNVGLLLQHGKAAIQLDDDVVLDYKAIKTLQEQTEITTQTPLIVTPYETAEVLESNLVSVTTNPLTMYEAFFATFDTNRGKYQFGEKDDVLTNRFALQDAHILTIQNGLYGDACVQRFHAVHQLANQQKSFIPTTKEHYEALKHTTQVIQSVRHPAVTDSPLSIAAHIAMSGDHIHPPFPPVGRAEDFLAGVIASQCCVGAFALHLGSLAQHIRPDIMAVPKITDLGLPPSNRILAGIIGSRLYTETTELNLVAVGNVISEFSDMSPDMFQNYLCEQIRAVAKASYHQLQQLLSEHRDLPAYWQADLRSYITQFQVQSTASDADLVQSVGDSSQWLKIQQSYQSYAYLLKNWSLLWTISRENNLLKI